MAALCVLLVVACAYDYGSGRIPNLLLLGMLAAGMVQRTLAEGPWGAAAFLTATAVMTALMYPFFKIGAMGAGDVKLLGVCAGYLPGSRILLFLFFSMLTAAIFSLIKFWRKQNLKERMQYLAEYLWEVSRTGNWHLYVENLREQREACLCLSGPVLISALMYWGGVY
ncbi:MAG: prepilin peptidase [Lachnospiraceae bacterium]|nr:prepilin peptidase [Lachnospiraceae bacterium]